MYTLCYEEYSKGNSQRAVDILRKSLRDNYLYKLILNSFTTLEREKCKDILYRAAHNRKLKLGPKKWSVSRYVNGLLEEKEVRDIGFCIMQLLDLLEKNKDKFIPLPSDEYKRIGRRVVDNYNAFRIDSDAKETADFRNLVFSKEKLNVSIRYAITGKVIINPRQARAVGLDGNEIKAKIFREQTIIRDGYINIEKFKALLSKKTIDYLRALEIKGLLEVLGSSEYQYADYTLAELDITKLPVVNKSYATKGDSLDYILDRVCELREAECRLKVLKYYLGKVRGTVSHVGHSFSRDQLQLLATYGYTPNGIYQGIDNQFVKSDSAGYQWRSFEFGLKGFSNLPRVEHLIGMLKSKEKKLNGPETVMVNYIKYLAGRKMLGNHHKISKLVDHQKSLIRSATKTLAQIKLAKTLNGGWWTGLRLDNKGNYLYEKGDKTLVVKVQRKYSEV